MQNKTVKVDYFEGNFRNLAPAYTFFVLHNVRLLQT